MARRRIVAVDPLPPATAAGFHWHLDFPRPGSALHHGFLEIQGWAVGLDDPVAAIELRLGPAVLARLAIDQPRSDVVAHFGAGRLPPAQGFQAGLDLDACGDGTSLDVVAISAAGAVLPMARLRLLGIEDGAPASPLPIQPVFLRTLGRSGSSAAMRLLLDHPAIVGAMRHPYEVRPALYWAHLYRALSRPADHAAPAETTTFHDDPARVGRNPFWRLGVDHARWFDQRYPGRLAAFCRGAITDYYGAVASDQGKTAPRYFAEKLSDQPAESDYARALLPEARHIFLIRDPRDTLVSMLRFNARRGSPAFGRERAGSDEEFALGFARGFARLQASWSAQGADSLLVAYEHLIAAPEAEIHRILDYLGLQAEPAVVARLAAGLKAEATGHMTSASQADSIAKRWSPEETRLAALVAAAAAAPMAAFGYR